MKEELTNEKDLNQQLTDKIILLESKLAQYEPKTASQGQSTTTSTSHQSMSQKRSLSENKEKELVSKKIKMGSESSLTQVASKTLNLEELKGGGNADSTYDAGNTSLGMK